MKKPAPAQDGPARRKKTITTRKLGAAMAAFLAISGYSAYKGKVTSPAPIETTDSCAPVFKRVSSLKDSSVPALDRMLERVEGMNASTFGAIQEAGRNYAVNRGYAKKAQGGDIAFQSYDFAPGEPHKIISRMTWDLRVLGFYKGEDTGTFTENVSKALHQFQYFQPLDPTGQPDGKTLKILSEEALLKRLQIGLYAQKAALNHDLDAMDLLMLIHTESEGNPNAAAKTSTALGLGQFIESTWLERFAVEGARLGYEMQSKDARKIIAEQRKGKKLSAEMEAGRKSILSMRTNVDVAIDMIAAYGKYVTDNNFNIANAYVGYVFGREGAATLLKNPGKIASTLMPAESAANKSLFFKDQTEKRDKKKRIVHDVRGKPVKIWSNPRTTQEVIAEIHRRIASPGRMAEAQRTLTLIDGVFRQHPVTVAMPVPEKLCPPVIKANYQP